MLQHNYIGCDVSKAALDFFCSATSRWRRIDNSEAAIDAYVSELDAARDFVVMEATGIHDRRLRHALAEAGIAFSRRNPTQARRFAQAGGRIAKTDRIDARMLAEFGRRFTPEPDEPPCAARERIAELARRRDQIVEDRACESRHLSEARDADVIADIKASIAALDTRIEAIGKVILDAIDQADPATARTFAILRSAPGVGPVTAVTLIAHMPELGSRSPKTIASLAGLAPFNNESGRREARRSIKGGRSRVRRALYMAALGAIKACSRYGDFYKALADRAGSKKLAIVAIARKLLTALNAMIRDQKPFAQHN